MAETIKITLDKSSDISKVEQLHEKLEALLESPVAIEIDASKVERIDTSSLQVLVSFLSTMTKHHQDARITKPSTYFSDTARLMGMSQLLNLNC